MAVREENRRGKRILIIDFRFRQPDGKLGRYRRDSEAVTKTAAREEERRVRDRIARTGAPFEAPAEQAPTEQATKKDVPTFRQVVEQFRASFMVTDLKASSRRGYGLVLDGALLPKLGDMPITAVDGAAAAQLDLEFAQRERQGARKGATIAKGKRQAKEPKRKNLARSTRNNVQIILRSLLRFAVERGILPSMPTGLPRLKKIGQTVLEIPTDEQVEVILTLAAPEHRLSFTLMSDAGLRPNEVRALRWRDVQLEHEGNEVVGGFLSVREGLSFGHVDTPKTGQREIPLTPRLARLLGHVTQRARDEHVALTKRRQPWGQYGLAQAFDRVRNRAGLAGWSIYALRHHAITMWLRKGIPVHVVQRMAGHSNLSTTQRYVHHLKSDLEDAALRLSTTGNRWETPRSDGGGHPDQAA